MHFAAADVQEASGQPQAAAQVYEALLPAAPAAAEGEGAAPKVEMSAEQQALVWIQYMRFVRRSEGRDKSRKVCCHCQHCGAFCLLTIQTLRTLDYVTYDTLTMQY